MGDAEFSGNSGAVFVQCTRPTIRLMLWRLSGQVNGREKAMIPSCGINALLRMQRVDYGNPAQEEAYVRLRTELASAWRPHHLP